MRNPATRTVPQRRSRSSKLASIAADCRRVAAGFREPGLCMTTDTEKGLAAINDRLADVIEELNQLPEVHV